MATFVCTGCGKCCRSFGAFITAERQLGPRDYYCRYGITNEYFSARVAPEYAAAVADAFDERSAGPVPPGTPCIFLQPREGGGGFACAIHPARPPVCRDFRCYRMLIMRADTGACAGRVIGRRDLSSEDPVLQSLWAEAVAPIPDDRGWTKSVLAILAAHGYRGDPVGD